MTERAYQSFERIVERRKNAKAEPIIVDGYQNKQLIIKAC